MTVKKFLNAQPLFEIVKYRPNPEALGDCVVFSGSPRKHPYDPDALLLILNPFSSNTSFLEFKIRDIIYAENLPSLATDAGENLSMTKIWVRKGSLGLKYEPFEVGEPLKFFKDSDVLHQNLAGRDINNISS